MIVAPLPSPARTHAPQVTQEERWKIILYINKLQDDALAAAAPASTVATAAATDTTKAN